MDTAYVREKPPHHPKNSLSKVQYLHFSYLKLLVNLDGIFESMQIQWKKHKLWKPLK